MGRSPRANHTLPLDTHPYNMALRPLSVSLNSPIDTSSPAQSIPGSPIISGFGFGSPAPSLAPSDSASAIGSCSALHSQSASYNDLRHLHTTPHSLGCFELNVNWNTGRQRLFEEKLGRVTAACGFPLSWVDNPEWIGFCDEFIPAARLPSHNTLSRRIIPNVAADFQAHARTDAKGHYGTLQDDGWTGVNNHHLLASMVAVNGKVHPIQVDDVSGDRKTVENLVQHLERAIEELTMKWEITLVAIVTDASGECRKAKKILRLKYPSLIILDCYAHQVCQKLTQVESY